MDKLSISPWEGHTPPDSSCSGQTNLTAFMQVYTTSTAFHGSHNFKNSAFHSFCNSFSFSPTFKTTPGTADCLATVRHWCSCKLLIESHIDLPKFSSSMNKVSFYMIEVMNYFLSRFPIPCRHSRKVAGDTSQFCSKSEYYGIEIHTYCPAQYTTYSGNKLW